MRFALLALSRALPSVALASAILCSARDAAALHVTSTLLISESGELCASSPDVAFFNGQFDVSYTGSIVSCGSPTIRALRLWRVDASMVARLPGRIAPTITGTQVIGRLAVAPLPEPQLIVAALAVPNATALYAHVQSALAMGPGPSSSGTLPNPATELVDGALDCFGARCDYVSIERSPNVASRRVRISTSPFMYDGTAAPRMITAVRASVVENSAGPWELFANNSTVMPWVNPMGVVSASNFMPNTVTGAVGVRGPTGIARVFAATDAGGFERVHLLSAPFTAAVASFNYSERVSLTDADNFVPSNSYALAAVAPGSNSVRAVVFQDSTGLALTTAPAVISVPAGWSARSARIAATRGSIEGRALVVYELANAMNHSQVWAAFVTCSQNDECDDADPNTTDRCAAAADSLRACQHFAFVPADASRVDAAIDEDVAVVPRDSGVDAEAGFDSATPWDASTTDGASLDVLDAAVSLDASTLDAPVADASAGPVIDHRITGGSCDCRAAVGPSRAGRTALACAVGAALAAFVRRRRRR